MECASPFANMLISSCAQAGIKLKSKHDDDGVYTPGELYNVLTDIYT